MFPAFQQHLPKRDTLDPITLDSRIPVCIQGVQYFIVGYPHEGSRHLPVPVLGHLEETTLAVDLSPEGMDVVAVLDEDHG